MLPEAAIGADVIVGFPGETNEEFQTTVEFIPRVPLTSLHVFSFSERPGTEAANSNSGVPFAVIRERAKMLRSVSQEKASRFRESLAGSAVRALTLARSGENWTGAITGNYLKVRIRGSHAANQWREVRLPSDPLEAVDAL
jgi:threonylcarbamoyladenosine tRNA methylthiotransferase MtaB